MVLRLVGFALAMLGVLIAAGTVRVFAMVPVQVGPVLILGGMVMQLLGPRWLARRWRGRP